MFNFIAGVRSSSPVPSSRHLAISSQHLLVQARAHKTMGNLEEAQKSYREAIEKAKIELEENLGNLQAKRAFDAIRDEFLIFLKELPLNGHPVSSPAQAKNAQVEYLFEKALSTLGSLELPNKPSLFLVYAHDNPSYGKAEAAISRYLIEKLSQIRVNLYSDQTPMGQPSSRAVEDWKEDGKLEDILTSQLCLLPTRLRDGVEPVDKVVVCCSEVLEKYLEWPHYEVFYRALREAYRKDCEQKGTSAIREVVKAFSLKAGFHHVLTEMAFLQIRTEQLKDQHGIIPVSLTPKSSKQCLGHFIAPTTVRMEDISRFKEQAKAGRDVYLNQGQHLVLFKLIERLFVSSNEVKPFINKFWQGYSECTARLKDEHSTLDWSKFTELVDRIFGDIDRELRSQFLQVLQQHKNIVEKLRPLNLSNLRKALYQHYKRSNLSIQRVSGDKVSLDDCYINLAIVESQAQREKDKEELEKQAATFERLPSSERLEATNPNKLIALDKLFTPQKLRDGSEGVPKRILIQGRAGIGKTTLCKKLVYEYHKNKLYQDRFESVLWVPLRQLKTHSPKRLEELLCTQYFVGHEKSQAEALSKVFHAHQGKALFILDGLDEVVAELEERSPLREFVQNLLSQAHVVITSRPAGVDTSLLDQLDLELETVGFSPDNVQRYIEKYVPALNRTAIRQFISRTPLIQGLMNIPIQLDALYFSWNARFAQNQEAVTMAMLYETMTNKLWRKDCVRLEKEESSGKYLSERVIESLSEEELEELISTETTYLGYLAFKGLETGKIEFSVTELGQRRLEFNKSSLAETKLPYSFTTELKKTSFLHTADAQQPEAKRYYHFLHLTFQEFFAAKFLVRYLQAELSVTRISAPSTVLQTDLGLMLSQAQLETFIAQHKYNPRYEIVWWMVAGLLKGIPLEHFFTFLGQTPRDLIGGHHQQVMMGCLSEAHDQLNPETVLGLEKELMQWFHFEMKLSGESSLGRHMTFPEPLLLTLLNQPESKKTQIIKTLGARSTLSEATLLALVDALQDENWDVRSAAARVLEGQKTQSKVALSAWISALQDKDKVVRSAAARVLEGQETQSEAALLAWIDALQHPDPDLRSVAMRALEGQETQSEAALLAWIDALQHPDQNLRSVAMRVLEGQEIQSEAALLAWINALHLNQGLSRSVATRVLGGQSTLSEAAVQALIRDCQNQSEDVRYGAASALGSQAVLSEGALLALSGALQDKNENVRSAAARALEGLKTLSEAAVQALIGALQDKSENVRSATARALGGQSTLSDAAVQALIKACQHQDKDVSAVAARVLEGQKTQSEAALQAWIGALQHRDKVVRSAAVRVLGGQKTLPEAVLQALIDALQHQNNEVRYAATRALCGEKTLSELAFLTLIGALRDKNEGVRIAAARALELNLTQLYGVLPSLEVEQIQTLYREFLFGYSCAHIAPLYVQGNKLHFYTEAGPGQPIGLTSKQIQAVTEAFEAVQVEMENATVQKPQNFNLADYTSEEDLENWDSIFDPEESDEEEGIFEEE